jgi:hypothetical protein
MPKPTIRVILGLVLLLAGTTMATAPTDIVLSDVSAQSPEQAVYGEEMESTDQRKTPLDRTEMRGRMGRSSVAPATSQYSGTRLNVTYTFQRLPDQPGIVRVTLRLPRAPATGGASIDFRENRGVTVINTTNVERIGSSYDWAGERPAAIVYRLPINWTYTGNRAASWTLVQYRQPSIASIDAGASVTVRRRARLAGEGYVGSTAVLLGEHDVYERQAGEQRIRVVIPDNVTLRNDPRRTVSALASAARSVSIGGRDEVVHVFVTPQIRTEAEQLFQPGFAIGDNTLLIDAESEFDVWTHEYVHSRQEFPDTGRLRWLTEGSAEYYGWLLSVQQGYDSWSPLREVFTRGTADDSILADPETWRGETEYNKGALVLGVLDHEIRVATDGERTLQDVLRQLNADADPTLDTFIGTVREVGGPDAAAAAERYVTTSAAPNYRPDEDRLIELYAGSSSGLNASLQTRTRILSVATTGTNGTTQFNPDSEAIRIPSGQTLRIRGRITNVGDNGGVARVAVQRISDGRTSRLKTPWVGWLRPQGTITRNETLQFSRPGRYEVLWGDYQITVSVAPSLPDTGSDITFLPVLGVLGILALLGVAAWRIAIRR